MFKSIVLVQWKWSRWSVLLLSVAALAVTSWTVSGDMTSEMSYGRTNLFNRMQTTSVWYRTIAIVAGFLLAMHAWRTDHQGRNVYALSLPIERWRFALYRYGAGALFGMLIICALWLSALMAVAIQGAPAGLHAYPGGLAVRVGMVLLVAYAGAFAIWSSTARAPYYIAGTVVAVLAALAIADAFNAMFVPRALGSLWQYLGIREVFGGRWFLYDV
ncbi:MAG: hypothetical protein ACRERX_11105 [Pseudomonas sp.]